MARSIAGVKLEKIEDGLYRTSDGEYEVYRDDEFETECDGEHPCRLTDKMRADFRRIRDESRTPEEAERRQRAIHGVDAFAAWREGRKGWYCYGGQPHWYTQWVAWTGSDRGWSGEWCNTLSEAVGYLRRHLEEM